MDNKYGDPRLTRSGTLPDYDRNRLRRRPELRIRNFNQRVLTEERRPSPSFRLIDPEPLSGGKEVTIHRGDLITLSIKFPYKERYTCISVRCAGIPVLTREHKAEPDEDLPLEIELRDANLPGGVYFSAFCNHHRGLSLIPETGACTCLVRFHGQSFPIENQNAKICFEFPIVAKGCEKNQKYQYVRSCAFLVSSSAEQDIHDAQDKVLSETTGSLP